MKIADKDGLFARANSQDIKNAAEVINLSKLKPAKGFAIDGKERTELVLLESVNSVENINNDGIDDLIIDADVKKFRKSYIIFGDRAFGNSGTMNRN